MKKILLLTMFISAINCKTINQEHNNIKDRNMEKFNITEFRKKETKMNVSYLEENSDTIIETIELNDIFQRNVSVKESPYHTKKAYYKSNYHLKAESTYFYNIPIGITKKYDEKGNPLEKIDWAEREKRIFSIEQLIEKMKSEFDIDLLDPKDKGVSCSGNPLAYSIGIHPKNSHSSFRLIKIDAKTGELISDEILNYEKD